MFDITQRRATETGVIKLKNGDGSPLRDDQGNQLTVTAYGPGSKVWQDAQAEVNRKRIARMQESGGSAAAALDDAKVDQIAFLVAVTVSFDGWTYPVADKAPPHAMFRAAYEDDLLGYIRDQVHAAVNDWSVFTKGSAAG